MNDLSCLAQSVPDATATPHPEKRLQEDNSMIKYATVTQETCIETTVRDKRSQDISITPTTIHFQESTAQVFPTAEFTMLKIALFQPRQQQSPWRMLQLSR